MDLIIYFKYYLPNDEYSHFIDSLYIMLIELKNKIHTNAFDYIRGHMGIRNINDLVILKGLPKDKINYNKFEKKI